MEVDKNAVAERLKTIFKLLDMTNSQLAERLNISVQSISNLNNGESLPRFETIMELYAIRPTINPRYLFLGEGPVDLDESSSFVLSLSAEVKDLQEKIENLKINLADKEEIIKTKNQLIEALSK